LFFLFLEIEGDLGIEFEVGFPNKQQTKMCFLGVRNMLHL